MPRIGTLPLQLSGLKGSPSRDHVRKIPTDPNIGATGSHVPNRSPSQARAAYVPDATWAVNRHPPGFIPRPAENLGFDVVHTVSTRHRTVYSRSPEGETANHRKRRRLNVEVVERCGKATVNVAGESQEGERK